jgi:hypothetical protein
MEIRDRLYRLLRVYKQVKVSGKNKIVPKNQVQLPAGGGNYFDWH